ncbi:hypothetical protein QVD17_35295 [Tagetes erecta]|uniref:DUF1421 domain-containing protein n=1 Tax=Tagetes erecta TaxID=13708 RepID=A0AAD8NF25_TARER|nr:hypothetical protein QVD17_35295 [Tagetes erecta]
MASGSSSKGAFDFASDDILCSYEDYTNQEQSNGTHSDSATKEFNKSRMARTSVFPNSSYGPPDDDSGSGNNHEVIILAVERTMKKHTDNLMRFLEGLSSRLSQLELYCYNLDKSIGEMRSDLTRDHGEAEAKLKFLEKHVQEVHRSVQILRDKQELADTQKELAKLQLAHKEKESSSSSSHQTDDEGKKETLPAQPAQQQQLAIVPAPQPPATQPHGSYYMPQAPAPPAPIPAPTQTQYQQPQPQAPPQVHSYQQQQWAPQQPQPHPQPPQPHSQPGSRPASPQVYPQYLMTQPPVNPEPLPNSMPMQMPYSAIPPPGSNQPMGYSYGGGPVRATAQPQPPPPQQPAPQHLKPGFGGDAYGAGGPSYMMYDNESGRVQHPSPGGQFYPPNQNQQQGQGGGMMARPPQQIMHNHPYNELIDKLVSMGYRGDHVMSVIQRLDESGQTVDFNAVLDKLNGHPSQRTWSG